MRRGEVWWASLPDPLGSGLGFRSPVVVLQSNSFNQSHIDTVVVAVITSNLRLAAAPGNVFIEGSLSKLTTDSVVNVSQVLTIDKRLLTGMVSKLPEELMNTVDDGLRLVLSL